MKRAVDTLDEWVTKPMYSHESANCIRSSSSPEPPPKKQVLDSEVKALEDEQAPRGENTTRDEEVTADEDVSEEETVILEEDTASERDNDETQKPYEKEVAAEANVQENETTRREDTIKEDGSLNEKKNPTDDDAKSEQEERRVHCLPELQNLRYWLFIESQLYPGSPVLPSARNAVDTVQALQDSYQILLEEEPPAIEPCDISEYLFEVGNDIQRPFSIEVIEVCKLLYRLAMEVHYAVCVRPTRALGDFYLGIEQHLSLFIDGLVRLMIQEYPELGKERQPSEPENEGKESQLDTVGQPSGTDQEAKVEQDTVTELPGPENGKEPHHDTTTDRSHPEPKKTESDRDTETKSSELAKDGEERGHEASINPPENLPATPVPTPRKDEEPENCDICEPRMLSKETGEAIANLRQDFMRRVEALDAWWENDRQRAYVAFEDDPASPKDDENQGADTEEKKLAMGYGTQEFSRLGKASWALDDSPGGYLAVQNPLSSSFDTRPLAALKLSGLQVMTIAPVDYRVGLPAYGYEEGRPRSLKSLSSRHKAPKTLITTRDNSPLTSKILAMALTAPEIDAWNKCVDDGRKVLAGPRAKREDQERSQRENKLRARAEHAITAVKMFSLRRSDRSEASVLTKLAGFHVRVVNNEPQWLDLPLWLNHISFLRKELALLMGSGELQKHRPSAAEVLKAIAWLEPAVEFTKKWVKKCSKDSLLPGLALLIILEEAMVEDFFTKVIKAFQETTLQQALLTTQELKTDFLREVQALNRCICNAIRRPALDEIGAIVGWFNKRDTDRNPLPDNKGGDLVKGPDVISHSSSENPLKTVPGNEAEVKDEDKDTTRLCLPNLQSLVSWLDEERKAGRCHEGNYNNPDVLCYGGNAVDTMKALEAMQNLPFSFSATEPARRFIYSEVKFSRQTKVSPQFHEGHSEI
ncbi:MAG: hypothetical protein Q9216_004505 [Gyalolechia sp. 2 TL-2023]